MTQSWRIPTGFDDSWNNLMKRVIRLERRPAITNATQILGPGAGPYAVLLNDWNDEVATFNGTFYSEPGAMNAPDAEGDPIGTPSTMYWLGETLGTEDKYGFQRLTRFRLDPDGPGSWDEYRRRFYPTGDMYSYSAWEPV
jgi:hypothetical protein